MGTPFFSRKQTSVSFNAAAILTTLLATIAVAIGQETLAPLVDGKAPQTFDELWAGFDPRAEPLDVEVLKEWEEDGVVMKVLRYRVGIFKGKKSMMAAVFGYPKDAKKLPGLVQIHGGGQFADYRAVLSNAKAWLRHDLDRLGWADQRTRLQCRSGGGKIVLGGHRKRSRL